MFLVANTPRKPILVDKHFLTNGGEEGWTEGYLVSVKSVRNHTLLWEAYIVDQAGVYDKLPTHALKTKPVENKMELEDVEMWNNPSEHITIIEKDFLAHADVLVRQGDKHMRGTYWFTIDFGHPDVNVLNVDWSMYWTEHKSKNIVALENGNIVAVPNNFMRILDDSLSPKDVLEKPVYLRRAINEWWSVEQTGKAYGESEEYYY